MNKEYAFVIPSFKPTQKLITVVKKLRYETNQKVFIIFDGQTQHSKIIEEEIKKIDNITIINHFINMGKGAALKTAFNHVLTQYPDIEGVVTLDDDGQHSIKDAIALLEKLMLSSKESTFILGCRTFDKNIPFKSYIGNNISKFIYKIILGKKFSDTQTGLRALSKKFMEASLSIKSNRYEFETEQLALAVNSDTEIYEVPIETIYIQNNNSSSFRPIIDSLKIYFVLFRYAITSIITFLVDIVIFTLSFSLFNNILTANLLARFVTTIVQFQLVKHYVFKTKSGIISFLFFALYVFTMGTFSAWIQIQMGQSLGIEAFSAKIITESILFIVNFSFLRSFIFKSK